MTPTQAQAWQELVEAEHAHGASGRALEEARERFVAITRRERSLRLVGDPGPELFARERLTAGMVRQQRR